MKNKIISLLLFFSASLVMAEIGDKKTVQNYPSNAGELEVYRYILNVPIATYQDLADVLLMENAEFDKYPTREERIKRINELNLLDTSDVEDPVNTAVPRGIVAKSVMNFFKFRKGLLFWMTGWSRYANRDLINYGLMRAHFSEWSNLNGVQLMGVFNASRALLVTHEKWGKPPKQFEHEDDTKEETEEEAVKREATEKSN